MVSERDRLPPEPEHDRPPTALRMDYGTFHLAVIFEHRPCRHHKPGACGPSFRDHKPHPWIHKGGIFFFFTAFFPQFVDLSKPVFFQFLVLTVTFMIFSFLSLAAYALSARSAAGLIRKNGRSPWFRRVSLSGRARGPPRPHPDQSTRTARHN